MKYYNMYMDRQVISQGKHRELLELPAGRRRQSGRPWMGAAALAACALLAVGIWRFAAPAQSTGGSAAGGTGGIEAVAPGGGGTNGPGVPLEAVDPSTLPAMPAIQYPDATRVEMDMARMRMEGSFQVELSREELLKILWNGEDKPEIPWMLSWGGCDLEGRALYRSDGSLVEVDLWGRLEDTPAFSITLAPGEVPFNCGIFSGAARSEIRGVEVASCKYDGGYYLELLANGVGVRASFVGVADSLLPDAFVNWGTYEDGGLSLDHLLTAEHVPEWRSEEFSSLAQTRGEEKFAPYLPTVGPANFSEFHGHLTYQEGYEHTLYARWRRGYSEVSISIYLPEGEPRWDTTVDVGNPASYDTGLYELPWGSSVPKEYFDTFQNPVFRAEDMSREVVEARAYTVEDRGDADGPRMGFSVLHPDGTLVKYSAKGLEVGPMWALVEESLGDATPDGGNP